MMENKEFEQFDEIDQYVQGQLKGETLARFEARLKEDAELAKAVQLHKDMHTFGQAERPAVQELRGMQRKIRLEKKDVSPPVEVEQRTNYFKPLVFAASILFLLVLATYGYASLGNKHERLYATFAEYSNVYPSTKSGDTTQRELAQIKQAFRNKEYPTVIALSDPYLENHPEDYVTLLAKGIAELEVRQYKAALKTFTALKRKNLLHDKTDWYIALTYLRKNDMEHCRIVLKNIIKQEKFNVGQARELLRRLPD